MTIDSDGPTEKDAAYDALDFTITTHEVIDQLVYDGELSDSDSVQEFSVEELEEMFYEVILPKVEQSADETDAWSNSKHPMDPAHEARRVSEVLDEVELQELAWEQAELLVSELRTESDSNDIFESGELKLQIND